MNKTPEDKKAYYGDIPCWYNPNTEELKGRNWFYEICLNIALWFDIEILDIEAFPIWVEKDENSNNKAN